MARAVWVSDWYGWSKRAGSLCCCAHVLINNTSNQRDQWIISFLLQAPGFIYTHTYRLMCSFLHNGFVHPQNG